jgi:hypothetical protein
MIFDFIFILVLAIFTTFYFSESKTLNTVILNFILYVFLSIIFWYSAKNIFLTGRTLITGEKLTAKIEKNIQRDRTEKYSNETAQTSKYVTTDNFTNILTFIDHSGTKHTKESNISTGDKDNFKEINIVYSKKHDTLFELRGAEYFFLIMSVTIVFLVMIYVKKKVA